MGRCNRYSSINIKQFLIAILLNKNNISIDALKFGTFEQNPTIVTRNIPIGYKYFCTDKQSVEGATNGIEIIHKGNNIWCDAFGREIS